MSSVYDNVDIANHFSRDDSGPDMFDSAAASRSSSVNSIYDNIGPHMNILTSPLVNKNPKFHTATRLLQNDLYEDSKPARIKQTGENIYNNVEGIYEDVENIEPVYDSAELSSTKVQVYVDEKDSDNIYGQFRPVEKPKRKALGTFKGNYTNVSKNNIPKKEVAKFSIFSDSKKENSDNSQQLSRELSRGVYDRLHQPSKIWSRSQNAENIDPSLLRYEPNHYDVRTLNVRGESVFIDDSQQFIVATTANGEKLLVPTNLLHKQATSTEDKSRALEPLYGRLNIPVRALSTVPEQSGETNTPAATRESILGYHRKDMEHIYDQITHINRQTSTASQRRRPMVDCSMQTSLLLSPPVSRGRASIAATPAAAAAVTTVSAATSPMAATEHGNKCSSVADRASQSSTRSTRSLSGSNGITTMTEQAAMAGSQASLLNFLDTQSTRSSDSIADYHDGSSQEQPVREVVSTMPWYHGVISRAEAETRILKMGAPKGMFLIRRKVVGKSRAATFILTVVANNSIEHHVLQEYPNGYTLGGHAMPSFCHTLKDLVDYLSEVTQPLLKKPCDLKH